MCGELMKVKIIDINTSSNASIVITYKVYTDAEVYQYTDTIGLHNLETSDQNAVLLYIKEGLSARISQKQAEEASILSATANSKMDIMWDLSG